MSEADDSSDEIEVIDSAIVAVRRRPAMYVGSLDKRFGNQ